MDEAARIPAARHGETRTTLNRRNTMPKETKEAEDKKKQEEQQAEEQERQKRAAEEKAISELTDEELEEQQNAFLSKFYPSSLPETEPDDVTDRLGVEAKKAEEAKRKEDEGAGEDEDEGKKGEDESDEDEKKEQDDKKKKPVAPPLEDFRESQMSRIRKRHDERRAELESGKKEDDGLSSEERDYIQVLRRMGKNNQKYASLEKEHVAYMEREAAYIRKWLEEHPGEKYDHKGEEHQEFYEQNEVKYDQGDFDDAMSEIREERIEAKITRKLTEKASKEEKRRILNEAQPKINAVAYNSVVNFMTEAVPGFDKYAEKDDSGRKSFGKDASKKMMDDDPVAFQILMEESEPLAILVSELERFAITGGDYDYDKNLTVELKHSGRQLPVFSELFKFMNSFEREQLSKPAEETTVDGRRLVANSTFSEFIQNLRANKALSDEEKDAVEAEAISSYYTLSIDDFREQLISASAKRAATKIQKLKGGKADSKASGNSEEKKEPAKKEQQQAASEGRPHHPTTTNVADRTDTKASTRETEEDVKNKIVQKMWGM